jgi:hypothetical protein
MCATPSSTITWRRLTPLRRPSIPGTSWSRPTAKGAAPAKAPVRRQLPRRPSLTTSILLSRRRTSLSPAAPVPTLTRTPPARIQVANVAYCDTHEWTAVVQVSVVLCSLPLDKSSPPSGPPCSAPRVNGSATAAGRPLANGHASGTLAARRGMPPLRLFSRDAGDAVVEPALQAPPPPPPSSLPVSPTLRRMWINVPHGPSAPQSPSLTHVVVRSRGSPDSGTQGGVRTGGQGGTRLLPSGGGVTPPPPERPPERVGEPPARPRRWRPRCGGRWRPHPKSASGPKI